MTGTCATPSTFARSTRRSSTFTSSQARRKSWVVTSNRCDFFAGTPERPAIAPWPAAISRLALRHQDRLASVGVENALEVPIPKGMTRRDGHQKGLDRGGTHAIEGLHRCSG